MKHQDIISQMTLKEKCYLLSDKDFWQTRSVERLGVPSMTLSDGPHGICKQAGAGALVFADLAWDIQKPFCFEVNCLKRILF